MVCSRHHIHCSCGGDKASRKWLFCADFKRCLRGAAGRAAAQARAVLGNSGGRTAVAADYLALVTRFAERTGEVLRAAPTASRRQSGSAGRNAASGRNVGQVCANGAATTLHPQFSWVALTKCRCSEIVLGEAGTGYGKPLTRLTAQRKPPEMAIIRASCGWRDPAATAGVCHLGAKMCGRPGSSLRLSLPGRHLVKLLAGRRYWLA